MPNSYVQNVLNAFAQMDTGMLRFYLNDEYSYQDTTKDIFLNQLEKTFEEFKQVGDTELLVYKGNCASDDCVNCGKGGYRFVGNMSKNYIDFVFVTAGYNIEDIFDCSVFKTNEDAGELNSKADISFTADDNVDFEKTPEYWAKLNPALKAYAEIMTDPPRQVNLEEIEYWLAKHHAANERIGGYNFFNKDMHWTPFVSLYSDFTSLVKFVNKYQTETAAAIKSYKLIHKETDLLSWLLLYKTMYDAIPNELNFGVFYRALFEEPKALPSILLTDNRLTEIFEFTNHFKNNYYQMLGKYSIYTTDEIRSIYADKIYENKTEHIDSLRFHLDKRKEAEELGFNIPLYLQKEDSDTNIV